MKKSFVMLVTLVLTPFILFSGCVVGPKVVKTKTKTEMHRLSQSDFEDFVVPEINKIKGGESRAFPYAEFDQIWDSATIVLMQESLIVQSSKESGVIVGVGSLPLSIFVERGEPIKVYVNIIEDLYKRLDDPEKIVVEFKPANLNRILENFLDRLATQLYAGKKWKYLYRSN